MPMELSQNLKYWLIFKRVFMFHICLVVTFSCLGVQATNPDPYSTQNVVCSDLEHIYDCIEVVTKMT